MAKSLHPVRSDDRGCRWVCICDCGNENIVPMSSLRAGNSTSCGCYLEECRIGNERSLTHGDARRDAIAPEFHTWRAMRRRCQDPNDRDYQDYGGRGISVCDRWSSYENFIADMGRKPSKWHSIDRYPDNDGNYEPGNCRWATASQQRRNTRINRKILRSDGILFGSIAEAAEAIGSKHWAVSQVCRGKCNQHKGYGFSYAS